MRLKSRGAIHVLVVDDYRSLADALTDVLAGYGYEARVAYSSEEALRVSQVFKPHVLISDMILPDPAMDGFQLAKAITQELPR